MSAPITIAGFTILPITYSPSVTHVLYARQHVSGANPYTKTKNLPEGRTLFLVNLPPDATERELILLFKYAGTVERVIFTEGAEEDQSGDESDVDEDGKDEEHGRGSTPVSETFMDTDTPKVTPLPKIPLRTLRRSGGTAHVVFLDSQSVSRALSSFKPCRWPRSEEPSGLEHYIELHKSLRPPLDVVKAHADSYMAAFEYKIEKEKQKSQYHKGEAIVDEDGFTLVTRGGAYGKTLGGGVGVASKKFQAAGEVSSSRRKKKKTPKEKESFYSFQKAERQRKGVLPTSLTKA